MKHAPSNLDRFAETAGRAPEHDCLASILLWLYFSDQFHGFSSNLAIPAKPILI
jgi:hypothetical protein